MTDQTTAQAPAAPISPSSGPQPGNTDGTVPAPTVGEPAPAVAPGPAISAASPAATAPVAAVSAPMPPAVAAPAIADIAAVSAAPPLAAPVAPVTAASAGVSVDAVTAHLTLIQRVEAELDRIAHRIAVRIDDGVADLKALKSAVTSHLGEWL